MKFITKIINKFISWVSSLLGKSDPYQLNSREKRDVEEMCEEAPNAIVEYYKNGVVWHERTTQGNRLYDLVYWYDCGDYKAAVTNGCNQEDYNRANCHLYPKGEICLKDPSEPPYKRVTEARAKAIVWAFGYSEYLKTGTFPFN
jgi:hypothetical protein